MDQTDLAESILGALDGPWLGVMTYGSTVRGDETDESDIDVLQLVEEPRENYAKGRITVSVRTPWQLDVQARQGDSYVLSLILEGRILDDPEGLLTRTLAGYRDPTDGYARKWREFSIRNAMLAAVTREAFDEQPASYTRAALYLLRNATMLDYFYRYGEHCFSIRRIAEVKQWPQFREIFRGRQIPENLTWEKMHAAVALTNELYERAMRDNIRPETRRSLTNGEEERIAARVAAGVAGGMVDA